MAISSVVPQLTVVRIAILLDLADFIDLACLDGNEEMRQAFLSGKLFPIFQGVGRDSWRSGGVEPTLTKSRRDLAEIQRRDIGEIAGSFPLWLS